AGATAILALRLDPPQGPNHRLGRANGLPRSPAIRHDRHRGLGAIDQVAHVPRELREASDALGRLDHPAPRGSLEDDLGVLLGMRGRDRGLFRLTERSEGPLAGPSPRELGAQRDGVPDLAGERLHRGPDLGVLGAVEIRGLEVGEPLDEERVDDRGPDEGALGLDVVQWYAPHLSPTPGTACIQPARAVAASASRAPGRGTRDSDARKG